MFRPAIALLVALYATATSSAPSTSMSLEALFARADNAACAANYSPCTNADFPSNFCCGASETCIALAGNTTVLCCPAGSKCDTIEAISCVLSEQNATANPQSPIKTTALDAALEHCGTGLCCPFGYSCNAASQCAKDADQSKAPVVSSSSSSSSSTTSGTATSTSTRTGTSTSTATSTAAGASGTDTSSGGVNGGAVAAGVIVAVLVGGALAWFYTRRIRKKNGGGGSGGLGGIGAKLFGGGPKGGSGSSSQNMRSGPAANISAPIARNGSMFRSEFSRKSPGRGADASTFTDVSLDEKMMSNSNRMTTWGSPFADPPGPAELGDSNNHARYTQPGGMDAGGNRYTQAEEDAVLDYYNSEEVDVDNDAASRASRYTNATPPRTPWTPRTPRAPSSVSINVFADPSTLNDGAGAEEWEDLSRRRASRMTTFAGLMEEADIGEPPKGAPFLPQTKYAGPLNKKR